MVSNSGWMIGLAAVLSLTACSERDTILQGKREDLRADIATPAAPRPSALSIPAQVTNASWAQSHGAPSQRVANAALSATPRLAWSASIGAGDSRKGRITADPVVAGGRVFTLDAGARVAAHGTDGAALWSRDLIPATEAAGQASGGGLAVDDGRLYVSSGFGLLTALNAADGSVVWQQKLEATGSGTPTVAGDLVYLVSGDNTGWAIEKSNGRVRWQVGAAPSVSNVMGASAPLVTDELAIFAYGSGDLQGAFRKGGLRLWDTAVTGQRRFDAAAKVVDIIADPVLADGRVFVGTYSGRTVALNPGNGERIWTAPDGALGPVWPVGGSVFLVSDRNELLRLDAATGARVWNTPLPLFTRDRPKRMVEIFGHYGPILAGGRLVVASNDGFIRFFDPASGNLVHQVEVPGGATTAPVVAGGTLYVVSTRGQLHAFR